MFEVDFAHAIGEEEEAVGPRHAPTDVLDGVGRGLVRPLAVLDHHHRGTQRAGHQVEEALQHRLAVAAQQRLAQPRLGAGDVPQGTQGLGCPQVVAEPDVCVRGGGDRVQELGDQGALADPRLTPDEDHPAARRPDVGQEIRQGAELILSLQKHRPRLHRPEPGGPGAGQAEGVSTVSR